MHEILEHHNPLSLSVAVLTGDRDLLLRRLLVELKSQLLEHDEIIVLDTRGCASSREIIADIECTRVHYYEFVREPFDFAAARNELVRFCSKDGIAFIDDDAFPFPGWLQRVRSNLVLYDAVGGPSVAAGVLPEWWKPELNWTIGLSPIGTVLGEPGYYPSAGNLAARADFFRKHPFVTPRVERADLYVTGREDAHWWMERRLRGDNVALDAQQAVSHHVHADRLTWKYVKRRAQVDGAADWWRDPSVEKALTAPVSLAYFCFKAFNKVGRFSIYRGYGQFRAIWHSPYKTGFGRGVLVYRFLKGLQQEVKQRFAEKVWSTARRVRKRGLFPAGIPEAIFVSADCLIGDTILLRRHIQTLAASLPGAQIIVSARFPQLLTGLLSNVQIVDGCQAKALFAQSRPMIKAAIVPYYHYGNVSLWRKHLSKVGVTFDVDVGFERRRDYLLARKQVAKDLHLHEHENLSRLFRVWPLRDTIQAPPLELKPEDQEWWRLAASDLGINGRYVVICLGAGSETKEWPLECWTSFLRLFAASISLPIVVVGTANQQMAGEELAMQSVCAGQVLNLAGKTDIGKLCAVLSQSSFVMGTCSGPTHIARMFGVPTYTLFGATEPYRWGATEDNHLHAQTWGLKQKLTAPELLGRSVDFRMRLLDPEQIANQATRHFKAVILLETLAPSSPGPVEIS